MIEFVAHYWHFLFILAGITIILLVNYKNIKSIKSRYKYILNSFLLSAITIAVLFVGFIIEPLFGVFMNYGIFEGYIIIKPILINLLRSQFVILFILSFLGTCVAAYSSKGKTLLSIIIRASISSIIVLILIDIFINVKADTHIDINNLMFSLFNDIFGGSIGGLIIGVLIAKFKINTILIDSKAGQLILILMSFMLLSIVIVYFVFFYKLNTYYIIKLNKLGIVSFILSEKNKENVMGNKLFIPFIVDSIFIPPKDKIEYNVKYANDKKDIKKTIDNIIIGKFKLNGLEKIKDIMPTQKGKNLNINEAKAFIRKIFSEAYFGKESTGNINITGKNILNIIRLKHLGDKNNFIYYFNKDARIFIFKNLPVNWNKTLIGNIFDINKVIILSTEKTESEIKIINCSPISMIFINNSIKNNEKTNTIKIELTGKNKPIEFKDDISKINMIAMILQSVNYDKEIFIKIDKPIAIEGDINTIFGKPKTIIVKDINIVNSKGIMSIRGKDYNISENDILVIKGDRNNLIPGLGGEISMVGESREVILNTNELSYTVWSSISKEIQVALIGCLSLLIISLLIFYLPRKK